MTTSGDQRCSSMNTLVLREELYTRRWEPSTTNALDFLKQNEGWLDDAALPDIHIIPMHKLTYTGHTETHSIKWQDFVQIENSVLGRGTRNMSQIKALE